MIKYKIVRLHLLMFHSSIEHGLSTGESTCQAKFWNAPVGQGGKGVIEVSSMSRIALERTTKAKDAIILMGELAQQLGYYSCAWTGADDVAYLGEGGEALTVVDKDEAWMFHILPDDTGTSAIWVAQRVPDGHVSISCISITNISGDSDGAVVVAEL